MRRTFAFALSITAGLAAAVQPAVAAERQSLDAFVQTQMEERRIPGMAVAVIDRGQVKLVRTYGMASLEFEAPVQRSTPFSVASISKSFTAVSIMQLVEMDLLKLEDRVGQHLPDLPPAWRDISVHRLLNHTSGVPDLSVDSYSTNTIAQTRTDALRILSERPMDFVAGSEYRYNQTNYMLLGMLIEAKLGKPFEHALAEQQFAPLRISSARLGDARTIIPRRATTYTLFRFDGGRPALLSELEILTAEMPSIIYPAGGLNISVEDFARWLAALLDGKLLSRESRESLWAPARLSDGSIFVRPPSPSLWTRDGLGWILGEHDGRRFVGGTGGIRSAFFVYPDHDLAVIVLTNSQSARPESLVREIANRFFADRDE